MALLPIKLNMKQVINELIQVDNECKKNLSEIEEKEKNIDDYVSEKLEKIKEEINEKYQYKINFRKSENDMKLKKEKEKITNNTNIEIKKWEDEFLKSKNDKVEDIINNIFKRR